MKIALLGYGKMGKAIEAIALERGHTIGLRVDSSNSDFSASDLKGCDAAIEFSRPEFAVSNIQKCFEANVPVVVGTTGWYDQYENIASEAKSKEKALLTATNFSIGVNLFFAMNIQIAKLMNGYPEYDIKMEEIHHTQKLDHPSGTGITLAEGILDNVERKTEWTAELEGESASNPTEKQLKILSKRIDKVPGTHTITYTSEIDDIELKHTAHNRKGFATGAIVAAEWLSGKTGVFQMKDVLGLA